MNVRTNVRRGGAVVTAVLGLALGTGVAGCSEQGPVEKAGETVDEAVEKTGDRIGDALDDMTSEGPMEEAGRKADETAEKAKEKTEETVDSVRQSFED